MTSGQISSYLLKIRSPLSLIALVVLFLLSHFACDSIVGSGGRISANYFSYTIYGYWLSDQSVDRDTIKFSWISINAASLALLYVSVRLFSRVIGTIGSAALWFFIMLFFVIMLAPLIRANAIFF